MRRSKAIYWISVGFRRLQLSSKQVYGGLSGAFCAVSRRFRASEFKVNLGSQAGFLKGFKLYREVSVVLRGVSVWIPVFSKFQ